MLFLSGSNESFALQIRDRMMVRIMVRVRVGLGFG